MFVRVCGISDCSAPFTVDIITDATADAIASAAAAINRGIQHLIFKFSC